MAFRFIHTGDVHLDSPLKGLAGQEGAAAERIRTATRTAFANLVEHAIAEEVDFFIIAGDLYDGDWRDYQTGLFFIGQIGKLAKADIPVFLLYGNHDAESQITKRLSLPGNVHVFPSRKPQTFEIEGHRVALHGHSYRQRDVADNLVPTYPDPVDGSFNIGVLHTGLGGMGGHANYAPCDIHDLVNKGYDYWALGHVHQHTILHRDPHIVFCGNLQGRHIREVGPKGACLVTVEDGRVSDIDLIEVSVVRWTLVSVSVNGCDHVADVSQKIGLAIERAVAEEGGGRLLACRVELTGRTEFHDRLVSAREHLIAEARAAALALGDETAWIERLAINTEPLEAGFPGLSRNTPEGLSEIVGEAATDPGFLAQLDEEIGELLRKLPHDVRADAEQDVLKAAANGDFSGVIREATDYLTARLAEDK